MSNALESERDAALASMHKAWHTAHELERQLAAERVITEGLRDAAMAVLLDASMAAPGDAWHEVGRPAIARLRLAWMEAVR